MNSSDDIVNYGLITQGWSPLSHPDEDNLVLTEIYVSIRYIGIKLDKTSMNLSYEGTIVNATVYMRAQLEDPV